jgi:hypothetical protein
MLAASIIRVIPDDGGSKHQDVSLEMFLAPLHVTEL